MTVKALDCPMCGHPLPPHTRQNELITCPACSNTLYLSDWRIGFGKDAVVVATPTRIYHVSDQIGRDDLCDTYRCAYTIDGRDWQGMFRVSRRPADNDLVQNEAQIIYHLQGQKDYDDFQPFLPKVLESFTYQDATLAKGRRVNIFALHERLPMPNILYTLAEIHTHYPNGIDPRDMAWMWRRLLYALGFIHESGVVHGGLVPSHVMIEPIDHKLFLNGWGFAARLPAAHMTAVSLDYETWYPQHIFNKQPPTTTLDLTMGARCMMYLIGADPTSDTPTHRNLEPELARYFAQCLQNPPPAWKLLEQFDAIIEKLWGPRTFRIFTMPYK